MEAIGWKKRLQYAKNNSEYIKIIFQYPNKDKAIIRKGIVIDIFDDCFSFKDRFDGLMTFSYNYLEEVSKWEEKYD